MILNHLNHTDLQAADPDIAQVPPSTLNKDVPKIQVDQTTYTGQYEPYYCTGKP